MFVNEITPLINLELHKKNNFRWSEMLCLFPNLISFLYWVLFKLLCTSWLLLLCSRESHSPPFLSVNRWVGVSVHFPSSVGPSSTWALHALPEDLPQQNCQEWRQRSVRHTHTHTHKTCISYFQNVFQELRTRALLSAWLPCSFSEVSIKETVKFSLNMKIISTEVTQLDYYMMMTCRLKLVKALIVGKLHQWEIHCLK